MTDTKMRCCEKLVQLMNRKKGGVVRGGGRTTRSSSQVYFPDLYTYLPTYLPSLHSYKSEKVLVLICGYSKAQLAARPFSSIEERALTGYLSTCTCLFSSGRSMKSAILESLVDKHSSTRLWPSPISEYSFVQYVHYIQHYVGRSRHVI